MSVPLSLLELSPVGADVAPGHAIRESVEIAQLADRLGYARFWVAEHHNAANIACSAPEVLIAHVAACTERIKVGAGGVMVPNHAPLHVIEVFRTLEALHPGRIDLGLGRAPGTDQLTASALQRAGQGEVNAQLAELLAFEHGDFPVDHPYARITPMPSDVRIGSIWMLGSTLAGASIAAQLGMPYAFAGHFSMRYAKDALRLYRDRFQPSAHLAAPHAMLALTVVCGPDDAEAERLAGPMRVAIAGMRSGKRAPLCTVEAAARHAFTVEERALVDEFFAGAIVGGPATVAAGLRAAAESHGVQELMTSMLLPDLATRRAAIERTMAAYSA